MLRAGSLMSQVLQWTQLAAWMRNTGAHTLAAISYTRPGRESGPVRHSAEVFAHRHRGSARRRWIGWSSSWARWREHGAARSKGSCVGAVVDDGVTSAMGLRLSASAFLCCSVPRARRRRTPGTTCRSRRGHPKQQAEAAPERLDVADRTVLRQCGRQHRSLRPPAHHGREPA